ncbi:MAG: hypothetical protein KDK08_25955 [Rhizobiaceae bacterium]|nr:hypothetical protein [Rhizobiaceae bacterium]
MDTFARLRRLEKEPPIELSSDPTENRNMMKIIRRESLNMAWGRAIWARIAIVGWAVALVSIGFHVF